MALTVFWGLVPGGLSFIRFTEQAASDEFSFNTLQNTGGAVLAIALGTLIGFSVFQTFTNGRNRGSTANQPG